MAAGRPSKYDPKYCEEIVHFFKEGYRKGKNPIPLFEAFAIHIDTHRDTLHEWCKKYPEFSDAYKKAKMIQKDLLIAGGITGEFNPAFAIFTAKNITDMRDKKEVEHSGEASIKIETQDEGL